MVFISAMIGSILGSLIVHLYDEYGKKKEKKREDKEIVFSDLGTGSMKNHLYIENFSRKSVFRDKEIEREENGL